MAQKQTILLHIGMHKTATTSLQASLAGFSDGRVRYADLGRANHSLSLITAFSQSPEQHQFFARRGTGPEDLADRREAELARLHAALATPEPVLILSGEGLTDLSGAEVQAMGRMLGRHCDQIQVLAYLREPIGFGSSAYQQRVKGGRDSFDVPRPKYRKRFGKFLRVFGSDAVEFVPFAPKAFRNGCIITDFCDRIGVDADQVPKRRSNESLSAQTVALLRLFNARGVKSRGTPERARARDMLINQLAPAFPGRFAFAPDLVRKAQVKGDLAWIEDQAGFALPDPSDPPEDAVGSLAELDARAKSAAPALVALLEQQGLEPANSPLNMLNRLYLAHFKALTATSEQPQDGAPSP